MWPLAPMGNLSEPGYEARNILPLDVKAHRMWDRFCFALRPIQHPTDPTHKLYLQLVWLTGMNTQTGLVFDDWPLPSDMTSEGAFHPVRQGQVFLLSTTSPETHPLPSVGMLEIQYAVHRHLAGIRAAGALAEIFSEDPPDDDGRPMGTMPLSPKWQMLLEAAVEEKVLDGKAAQLWAKSFIRAEIESLAGFGEIAVAGLTSEECAQYGVYEAADG